MFYGVNRAPAVSQRYTTCPLADTCYGGRRGWRVETVMQQPGRVLIVDDDEDVLFAAEMLLGEHVGQVRTETRPQRLPELLAEDRFDLVLLDMNFTQDVTSGREGLLWLDRILELDPTISVVMITAFGDIELAVQAIKRGLRLHRQAVAEREAAGHGIRRAVTEPLAP